MSPREPAIGVFLERYDPSEAARAWLRKKGFVE
jgi:hypothetical protein